MIKNKNLIFGIHPLEEALQSGKSFEKVMVKQGIDNPSVLSLVKNIRNSGIHIQYVPLEKLNRITGKNHQGILAFMSEIEYTDLYTFIPGLFEQGRVPFILALDGITDVRNFGAIARTAECAGVDAIIIPSRESVSVNSDSMKTSAGALSKIPVCKVNDFFKALIYLKECGLQIIGATEKAHEFYYNADFCLPTVLIMGSEDTGISAKGLKYADLLVKIPMFGSIQSLNVSVAASVVIYEMVRQRNL